MRYAALSVTALGALLAGPSLSAAIQFNFTFTEAGTGFNDPALGAQRRGALTDAANSLAGYFVGYNTDISITVSSVNVNSSTLAVAGTQTLGRLVFSKRWSSGRS